MSALTSPRILVVDDDPDLRDLLCTYLGTNGFEVTTAGDGVAMRAALANGAPDAIVLDLMLPGEDGLSLTRWLRAQSPVPILMLSARGEEMDRVIGLEVGADDYLAKPFGPRELLARLRALMRRVHPVAIDGVVQKRLFSGSTDVPTPPSTSLGFFAHSWIVRACLTPVDVRPAEVAAVRSPAA